ncbi:D-ribose transporter ATP-binding protein, partial [Paracoccus sp. S4493]
GSGRTEIFDRLFGLSAETAGTVTIDGRPARITTPREAIEAGLAYVTEDRKRSGLVLTGDVRENLCLATLDRMSAGPVMNARAEGRAATRMIETLNIRTASDRLNVAHLSGGNQ